MKKATENLRFTTRFHENRPVLLADASFWSKRLNAEEEMLLQHHNLSMISEKDSDQIRAEVDLLGHVLQARERDGRTLDFDWVAAHVGRASAETIYTYLRTGQGLNPGQTFDLPVWPDIEIDDRRFTGRALTYQETLAMALESERLDAVSLATDADDLTNIEPLDGEDDAALLTRVRERAMTLHERTVAANRGAADTAAGLLNARLAEGDPIDGKWLLDRLQMQDLRTLTLYLRTGEVEDDEQDAEAAEAPNAAGADASTAS